MELKKVQEQGWDERTQEDYPTQGRRKQILSGPPTPEHLLPSDKG